MHVLVPLKIVFISHGSRRSLRYGTARHHQARPVQIPSGCRSDCQSACERVCERKRANVQNTTPKGWRKEGNETLQKKSLCAFDKRRTVFGLKGSRWQLSICRVVRNRDQEYKGYLQGLSMGIDRTGCWVFEGREDSFSGYAVSTVRKKRSRPWW